MVDKRTGKKKKAVKPDIKQAVTPDQPVSVNAPKNKNSPPKR